jgi:hypothetical protein
MARFAGVRSGFEDVVGSSICESRKAGKAIADCVGQGLGVESKRQGLDNYRNHLLSSELRVDRVEWMRMLVAATGLGHAGERKVPE